MGDIDSALAGSWPVRPAVRDWQARRLL